MNKKVHYVTLILVVFLMLFLAFTPRVFADSYPTWKEVNGKMYYYYDEYNYARGNTKIDGKLYVFDKNGVMQKGWYDQSYTYEDYGKKEVSHNWYYADPTTGELYVGSKKVNGVWYYFDSYSGRMEQNSTAVDNGKVYLYGNSGAWISQKGWQKISYNSYEGATWYYIGNDGACYEGWKVIGGIDYYFFEKSGAMADRPTRIVYNSKNDSRIYCFDRSGKWISNPGKWWSYKEYNGTVNWYFFDNTRYAKTGWQKINNTWYYFDEYDGMMVDRPTRIYNDNNEHNSQIWCFNKSGAWIANPNGWYSYEEIYSNGKKNVVWYHFTNGKADEGIVDIKGKKYLFSKYDGIMLTGRRQVNTEGEETKYYYFDDNGAMKTNYWYKEEHEYYSDGEKKKDVYYYWFGEDGTQDTNLSGWKFINNDWYYFENNYMLRNTSRNIKGKVYFFNNEGKMEKNGWKSITYKYSGPADRINTETWWYYLDSNGEAAIGWKKINSIWYWFDNDGRMKSNDHIRVSASNWNEMAPEQDWENSESWEDYCKRVDIYAFSNSGAMIRDAWYQYRSEYTDSEGISHVYTEDYYMGPSGAAIKNSWKQGKTGLWYYLGSDGRMITNQAMDIKEKTYVFNENGVMISNGWGSVISNEWDPETENNKPKTYWYYATSSGAVYKGLTKVGNKYYFFDEYHGEMRENYMYTDETTHKTYIFGNDGEQLFNSWYEDRFETYVDDQWTEVTRYLYVDEEGNLVSGWKDIDGKTYYFDEFDHSRVTGIREIEGTSYEFDDEGVLIPSDNPSTEAMSDPVVGNSTSEDQFNEVEVNSETEKMDESEKNDEEAVVEEVNTSDTLENDETKQEINETENIDEQNENSKEDIKTETDIIDMSVIDENVEKVEEKEQNDNSEELTNSITE